MTVAIITKSSRSHRAKWRADRMRLEERWDLHLTPARAPSSDLLTTGEVLWPVLTLACCVPGLRVADLGCRSRAQARDHPADGSRIRGRSHPAGREPHAGILVRGDGRLGVRALSAPVDKGRAQQDAPGKDKALIVKQSHFGGDVLYGYSRGQERHHDQPRSANLRVLVFLQVSFYKADHPPLLSAVEAGPVPAWVSWRKKGT